jgi:histidine triad (HIT) family protein
MLSEEQIKQVKGQLLKQIQSWPDEQRIPAQKQIDAMSEKELEEFLIKNNLIREKNPENVSEQEIECIFCLINNGKIPSYKIGEDKTNLAILEINPISKGHVIIIPKKHVNLDSIPTGSFTFAKKIANKLKQKLNPQKVDILTGELFEHGIINLLPIYHKENLGSPRKKVSEEELKELQKILEIKKKEKVIKPKKPKKEISIDKLPKAPVRVP